MLSLVLLPLSPTIVTNATIESCESIATVATNATIEPCKFFLLSK